MQRSFALLASFLFLNSGCAHFEIADFKAIVTLPASEDGFGISVLSKKEERINKDDWAQIRKRGIVLLPEEYKKLKVSILKNCHLYECKQITGAFDSMFLIIDDALKKLPN